MRKDDRAGALWLGVSALVLSLMVLVGERFALHYSWRHSAVTAALWAVLATAVNGQVLRGRA